MGKLKKPKKHPSKKKAPASKSQPSVRFSWVDHLRFEPIQKASSIISSLDADSNSDSNDDSLTIVSWNVLAQSYCSRRSHTHLPHEYARQVFTPGKRKQRILDVLCHFFCLHTDVLCLQEVDLDEIAETLTNLGYTALETPRGGGTVRPDACGIYIRNDSWEVIDQELIQLDDLATRVRDSDTSSNGTNVDAKAASEDSSTTTSTTNNGNSFPTTASFPGFSSSFLRRNVALLARIRHVSSKRTVVIANAHLYWNPGFEYVKLCQAHYILLRARAFCRNEEPLVCCGDFNSRPGGITHQHLTQGWIAAKSVAPWYPRSQEESDDEEESIDGNELVYDLANLNLKDSETNATTNPPQIRYLLDATLNRLCRWLRILGLDVALETEEQERLRTKEGQFVLLDRCQEERRTLVTTSTRIMQRRDCPAGAYCINPAYLKRLEVVMVHMLLTHGVVLEPRTFLSRCVVCNGSIVAAQHEDEKRRILQEYNAPFDDESMEVYRCDGCRQGYWWCDRPTSSASRVKTQLTRLLELCCRAQVPMQGDLPPMVLDSFNVQEERQKGWDYSQEGSELLRHTLDVVDWLKSDHLACPFDLESAYAHKDSEGCVLGERLAFTNVTHSFVNTLDYIFFDKQRLVPSDLLDIPTSFAALNELGLNNGHLLPSDVWPSDHLAIGARFVFTTDKSIEEEERQEVVSVGVSSAPVHSGSPVVEEEGIDGSSPVAFCVPVSNTASPSVAAVPTQPLAPAEHGRKCDCGCVPNILSLFEMAELRKQARLKKATNGTT